MPVTGQWPKATALNVERALAAAAKELSSFDARVEHYHVPQGGYAPLTGGAGSEVFSLEARLTPAHRRPGYTVWAIFQVFDPRRPNLAFLRLVERRDHDGLPDDDPGRPLYGMELDRQLCLGAMPVFNRALNRLDPTGRRRSQHVTCFHGRLTKTNLVQQVWLGSDLFRRFRKDGQTAILYCDFHEPLGTPLVYLARSLTTRSGIHLIHRTKKQSAVRSLIHGPDGATWQLGRMSTAIDEGAVLARKYLE